MTISHSLLGLSLTGSLEYCSIRSVFSKSSKCSSLFQLPYQISRVCMRLYASERAFERARKGSFSGFIRTPQRQVSYNMREFFSSKRTFQSTFEVERLLLFRNYLHYHLEFGESNSYNLRQFQSLPVLKQGFSIYMFFPLFVDRYEFINSHNAQIVSETV